MTDAFHKDCSNSTYLEVHDSSTLPGHLQLRVAQAGRLCSAHVDKDDAAEVALAVLEAAGWDDGYDEHDPDDDREVAVRALRALRDERRKQVERERQAREAQAAEDVEVAKYAEHRLLTMGVKDPYPWPDMPEHQRDQWRVEYRSNKSFFTHGTVAEVATTTPQPPRRILYHGAAEPRPGSVWVDRRGRGTWRRNHRGWYWTDDSGKSYGTETPRAWASVEEHLFPLYEVFES